jgi:DNA topoisomerase-3
MSDDATTPWVLMVAEKPSVAEVIAKALSSAVGGGEYHTERRVAAQCPVHMFAGTFQGRRCEFKVTSVTGHIYNVDFDAQHQDWSVDPASLYAAGVVKSMSNPRSPIPKHLSSEVVSDLE